MAKMSIIIDNINTHASNLVGLLEVMRHKRSNSQASDFKFENITGVPKIVTIERIENKTTHQINIQGDSINASFFIEEEDVEVGLNNDNWQSLQKLILFIMRESVLSSSINYKFLERTIFEWLIKCYKARRIEENLYIYLENKITSESKNHSFYFRMISLGIEEPFSFGQIKFEVLNKEKYKDQIESIESDAVRERVGKFIDDWSQRVLVKCEVYGILDVAKVAAKDIVYNHVNALKTIFIADSLDPNCSFFHLDFEMQANSPCNYIHETDNHEFDLVETIENTHTIPVIISKSRLKEIQDNTMQRVASIYFRKETSFNYLFQNGINHFGEMLSTIDKHEKIVKMISFFEHFIVPRNSGKALGQTRLRKDVMPKLLQEKDHSNYSRLIKRAYTVRDSYLHNRVRLPILFEELVDMHNLCAAFLDYLIDLPTEIKEIEDFHQFVGIKVK